MPAIDRRVDLTALDGTLSKARLRVRGERVAKTKGNA
jgi:hypothetical protein